MILHVVGSKASESIISREAAERFRWSDLKAQCHVALKHVASAAAVATARIGL